MNTQEVVLITGTSTGIGRFVFLTALNNCRGNIVDVQLAPVGSELRQKEHERPLPGNRATPRTPVMVSEPGKMRHERGLRIANHTVAFVLQVQLSPFRGCHCSSRPSIGCRSGNQGRLSVRQDRRVLIARQD